MAKRISITNEHISAAIKHMEEKADWYKYIGTRHVIKHNDKVYQIRYVWAEARKQAGIKSEFDFEREKAIEELQKLGYEVSEVSEVNSFYKFKFLLRWFVWQLEVNKNLREGRTTSGQGSKGDKLKDLYELWHDYKDFQLNVKIESGFKKNTPTSNFIHCREVNINPIFNNEGFVEKLQIKEREIKENANGKKEWNNKESGSEYAVSDLELFKNEPPNDLLKRFYEEYKQKIEEFKKNENQNNGQNNNSKSDISLNTILYGPPGTGKTYHTAIYAIAICDGCSVESLKKLDYNNEILPRYQKLIEQERVVFTTFHQSYGYEDFIEGIKPQFDDTNGKKEIYYDCENGKFKDFCKSIDKTTWLDAAWNSLLNDVNSKGGKVEIQRFKCTKTLVWDRNKENFYDTKETMNNQFVNYDYIKALYENRFEKKIGSGTGGEKHYNSEALLKKLKEDYKDYEKYKDYIEYNKYNKVFIIDEINRGNISKIFGELITLIEDDKRDKMFVTLPYSKDPFTVPKNVYILGTMNTADRSIALMDTALRRRFDFVEMMPDTEIFKNIEVQGISIQKLLKTINDRIEYLYDREHTIGHAYFKEFINGTGDIDTLRRIFKNKIIPLLQEYFYDDYEKIQLVLGDNNISNNEERFIKEKNVPEGFSNTQYDEGLKFCINKDLFAPERFDDEKFIERVKNIYTNLQNV